MSIFYMMNARLERVMKRGRDKVLSKAFGVSTTHHFSFIEGKGDLKEIVLHFQDEEEYDRTAYRAYIPAETAREVWLVLQRYFAATETMRACRPAHIYGEGR